MKIKNRNILCISNPNWEGDYAKTIVELMTIFSQENKVLYVDYQFTLKDVLFTLLGKADAPIKRMYGIEPNLRQYQLGENHHVYLLTPPPILPINFLPHGALYKLLLKFNASIIRNAIKKALRLLEMNEKLITIDAFNPGMGLLNLGKFNEVLHLYHCYDEIGAAVWAKKHGPQLEEEYMKKVDGVITTSIGLFNTKKESAQKCFLVRNGVNFKLFNQGFNENINIEKKIIGYIGSIDDRLDYNILRYLFENLSKYEFHFVGRITYPEGEKLLRKYNNVKILGSRSVKELPTVLKQFSAGLIPFVKNDFTLGIYPLKINEYLAAGLPVIMTDFSDLSEFKEIVSIADTPEEFMKKLVVEVEEDSFQKRKNRTSVAQQNSWESRVAEISEVIFQLEGENKNVEED